LSTNRSPFTLATAERALSILRPDLEPAAHGDTGARTRVLYAAHLAGLALNVGVVVGHSLAYMIPRRSPIPLGTSCTLALPYCLAYNRGVEPSLAGYIAGAVTRDRSATLESAAEDPDDLAGRLELPRSLAAVGFSESELDPMAKETVLDYPRSNNSVAVEQQQLVASLPH
jgi:alcohol dehydrogenase class IV